MNNSTDVLVLSTTVYKEQDALVHVFSRDFGLMTFLAKGVQKMQSKNRAFTQPYSAYRYHYDHKSGSLQMLKHAEKLKIHTNIQDDLMRSSLASLLSELSVYVFKHETGPEDIDVYFDYLVEMFTRLDQDSELVHILVLMLVDFLRSNGIEPEMDACVLCGDTLINSFSIEEGGLICGSCQRQLHSPILSVEDIRNLRISARLDLNHLRVYQESYVVSSELLKTWVHFLEFHTGIQLKSWDFIRKWSII